MADAEYYLNPVIQASDSPRPDDHFIPYLPGKLDVLVPFGHFYNSKNENHIYKEMQKQLGRLLMPEILGIREGDNWKARAAIFQCADVVEKEKLRRIVFGEPIDDTDIEQELQQ